MTPDLPPPGALDAALASRPGWQPHPDSTHDEPMYLYVPSFGGRNIPPGDPSEDLGVEKMIVSVDLFEPKKTKYVLITAGISLGCDRHNTDCIEFPATAQGLSGLLSALPEHERRAADLDLHDYLQHLNDYCWNGNRDGVEKK